MALWLLAVAAVALQGALVAAQQAACGSLGSFDFFPAGALPNQPAAWTQAAQVAAGNTDRGVLWPIALAGTPQPLLSFLPSHPLLVPDATAPAACGGGASPARRRSLAEAPAAAAVPAAFTWAVTLDGSPVAGSTSPVRLADATAPPSWGANVWGLPDGRHDLVISVTIAAASATAQGGASRLPPWDVAFSRAVTFYKLVQRPALALAPSTCAPDLTLGMSSMWPDPVAAPAGMGALWKPVYHVWGRFVQGLDGAIYGGEDGSTAVHFFDTYVTRELGSPSAVNLPISNLAEGTYTIWVEGSLTSDTPSLLSLAGADTFGDNSTDPTWAYVLPGAGGLSTGSLSLRGAPKFAGALVPGLNGTSVGVQSGNTALASMEGPASGLQLGDFATITWQYLGLGSSTCTIDGAPVVNSASAGGCAPPLRHLVNDTLTHQLVVTFTDVCGASRRDYLNFSVEGWVTNSTTDGLPLSVSDAAAAAAAAAKPLRATSQLTAATQGSGAAPPARWAAAATAAAVAAAVLAATL